MKALDLVKDALQEIGALGLNEELTSENALKALRVLNGMLSTWQTDRLTIFNLTRALFTFTAFKQDYTIGPSTPGSALRLLRPHAAGVDRAEASSSTAGPTPSSSSRLTSTRSTDGKTPASSHCRVPAAGRVLQRLRCLRNAVVLAGAVGFYRGPGPVSAGAAHERPKPHDRVDPPPAYEEGLRYNLAKRCCRPFAQPLAEDIVQNAADGLAAIKRSNYLVNEMRVDPALFKTAGAPGTSSRAVSREPIEMRLPGFVGPSNPSRSRRVDLEPDDRHALRWSRSGWGGGPGRAAGTSRGDPVCVPAECPGARAVVHGRTSLCGRRESVLRAAGQSDLRGAWRRRGRPASRADVLERDGRLPSVHRLGWVGLRVNLQTGIFSKVTDPDLPTPLSMVAFVDGYSVGLQGQSRQFKISTLEDGTTSAGPTSARSRHPGQRGAVLPLQRQL